MPLSMAETAETNRHTQTVIARLSMTEDDSRTVFLIFFWSNTMFRLNKAIKLKKCISKKGEENKLEVTRHLKIPKIWY